MSNIKIEYISDSLKKYNEDGYGMTANSFWVLDGASALNYHNFTSEENDVFWVVNWWNDYLKRNIEKYHMSIIEIVEEGVSKLNKDFSKFVDIETLSKLDRVSLGIAISRINKNTLECYILGDVEINIKTKDHQYFNLTDLSINNLDLSVMRLMASDKNRTENIVFKGFTQNELDLLKINRSKMNTLDGYYILEHEKEVIKNGIYKEYNICDIEDMLLMTDGYAQMYKVYELPELFSISKNKGLKRAVYELRKREIEDNDMKTYLRLKKHDDVTVILCTFNVS